MNQECCPPIVPDAWQGKVHEWDHKKFVKDRVRTFFYMPLGFGRTMKRLMAKLEQAKATSPEWLCLSDHTSKWNMDVYLAVDSDIPGADVVELSGRYLSRIYEGPFKDTKKWCKDFNEQAQRDKLEIEKQYMWYTTCPRCAEKRGNNCVVIFGKVKT